MPGGYDAVGPYLPVGLDPCCLAASSKAGARLVRCEILAMTVAMWGLAPGRFG
jgi:hypothetical protein